MIDVELDFDSRSKRFLEKSAKEHPKAARRAFQYCCGIILKNMRSMMSGKSKHIAKWDDFTKKFRAQLNGLWTPAEFFGGKLMAPDGRQLTMYPEGDKVKIGWVGTLEVPAIIFQEGGSQETDPYWRKNRYLEGFSHDEVPKVSVTPRRPVVDIAMDQANRHFMDWYLGAYAKVLKGWIKGWQVQYHKNAGTKIGAAAAQKIANAYGGIRKLAIEQDIIKGAYG